MSREATLGLYGARTKFDELQSTHVIQAGGTHQVVSSVSAPESWIKLTASGRIPPLPQTHSPCPRATPRVRVRLHRRPAVSLATWTSEHRHPTHTHLIGTGRNSSTPATSQALSSSTPRQDSAATAARAITASATGRSPTTGTRSASATSWRTSASGAASTRRPARSPLRASSTSASKPETT